MANDSLKNAAYSLVATAPSPASSGTSLVLTAGEGDRFPSSGSFDVVIWKSGESPAWAAGAATGGNFEICRATRSGDTLTLTRAQYGTSARTVVVGDQVAQNVTANMVQQAVTSYGLQFFGDGSDGDVTISSTVTLTRDMMYNNLTITTGAVLKTANYRVSVAGTLDLTAAPAGGIQNKGINANAPTGTNEGTAATASGSALTTTTLSRATAVNSPGGVTGTTATNTTVGNNGLQPISYVQRSGYGGGPGASSTGGGAAAGTAATLNPTRCPGPSFYLLVYDTSLTLGIIGANTGRRGSGDGTNVGGAGGAAGGGGGYLWIAARTINRGTGTAAGCIDASAGESGRGGSPTTGNCGGGGGASGAAGGYIHLIYNTLTGTTATNAIYANGGTAGNGGTGCGSGTNGTGGGGGDGGIVDLFDLTNNTYTKTTGTAGGAHSGTTGGTGGTCQANL